MIKSKKLPILEKLVIIPIVINIINNLIYIFKKKLKFFLLRFVTLNFLSNSKLEIKQKRRNIEKTVRFIKNPVDESK